MEEITLILTIAVVTMNRCFQLREALLSCLKCQLPLETEFIIIDNASSDQTEEIVRSTLSDRTYIYEKLKNNIGCGAGRNYAFIKSSGKYIYVLDDDAYIEDNQQDFFIKAIKCLEDHPEIISLTTQIYDLAWEKNRLEKFISPVAENLYSCYIFCGGSHFIRHSFFSEAPYLPNKYGYEELLPSLRIWDEGYVNAFKPDIRIVHNPSVNKWDHTDGKNFELLIKECGILFGLKKVLYPAIYMPLLWLSYKIRCYKYLSHIPKGKKSSLEVAKNIMADYADYKRIKVITVWKLFKKFGFTIF